jgi:hypothetical protein
MDDRGKRERRQSGKRIQRKDAKAQGRKEGLKFQNPKVKESSNSKVHTRNSFVQTFVHERAGGGAGVGGMGGAGHRPGLTEYLSQRAGETWNPPQSHHRHRWGNFIKPKNEPSFGFPLFRQTAGFELVVGTNSIS